MISFSHQGDDRFTRYGISHFLQKSGIAIDNEPGDRPGIRIGYGDGEPGAFAIRLRENRIEDTVTGNISFGGEEKPVFQEPANTGEKEREIAWFRRSGESRPCITATPGGIDIGFDLFRQNGYLLSGHLDRIWPKLEDSQREQIAGSPLVDFYEDLMIRCIWIGCQQLGLSLSRKALWPDRKKFAVCLTHDVDETKKTYQWITRPVRYLKSGDLHGVRNQLASFLQKLGGKEPYWTIPDIVKLEQGFGVTSTFFFLKESAKTGLLSPDSWHHWARTRSLADPVLRATMTGLEAAGFEVGLHGSFSSYRDRELLGREKKELEDVIGRKVTGTRQHHLNLEIPLTWTIHQAVGLSHDTSLGFRDRIGFRYGTCFPFHPLAEGNELPLLEIPLALMDITIPMTEEGWEGCRKIIEEVERRGGVLTVLWHPPVFNELEYPGAGEMYRRIIGLCQEKGAWITNSREVAGWWKQREETRVAMAREGQTLKFSSDHPDPRQVIEVCMPSGQPIRVDAEEIRLFVQG